jgi:predicted CoA-binding protein
MARRPPLVEEFLSGRRIAVTGVSRHGDTAANAVFKKLRDAGYEAFPVNPNAAEVEGVRCHPDVSSIPGGVDGVIVATHPKVAARVVRDALDCGVRRIWFHRSFGQGSVSREAVEECERRGAACIVGGCPLMYCEPVDVGHRCMRAVLGWRHRLPA